MSNKSMIYSKHYRHMQQPTNPTGAPVKEPPVPQPEPKEPPRPTHQVIDSADGKQLVQINPDGTTKVLQKFPPGMDIRNTPAGGVIAINPDPMA